MRLAILAVVAAGCGGRASSPAASAGATAPAALPFAAARWVPDRPRYVLASRNLGDAQRAVREAIDFLAVATGHDLRDAVDLSVALLGVDALHADPLAAIGVDPAGGWAVFSDEMSPTIVVHLAAPAQAAAFLARQRAHLATRAATVDGVEVVSAALPAGLAASWAIDGDWLWLHLAMPGAPDDGRWFAASHGRHEARWTGDWAWAQRAAGTAANLVGLLDLHGAVAGAVARLPEAVACARLAEPVGKASIALEGDERHVSARIALDLGPDPAAAERLRGLLLRPPSGWDATAARAAIAVAWNLDLAAARAWLAPCLSALGAPGALDDTGIRAARALLVDFDPGALSGSGAIALDVTSTAFLERQLARIPLRKTLERARAFGPYRGFSIACSIRGARSRSPRSARGSWPSWSRRRPAARGCRRSSRSTSHRRRCPSTRGRPRSTRSPSSGSMARPARPLGASPLTSWPGATATSRSPPRAARSSSRSRATGGNA